MACIPKTHFEIPRSFCKSYRPPVNIHILPLLFAVSCLFRRVAEIQIFEKTYLVVIKDETGLKFKMNDSTLFLIGSYAQKLVASY